MAKKDDTKSLFGRLLRLLLHPVVPLGDQECIVDRPLTHTRGEGCAEQQNGRFAANYSTPNNDSNWSLLLLEARKHFLTIFLVRVLLSDHIKHSSGKALFVGCFPHRLKARSPSNLQVDYIYTGGASVCEEAVVTSNFFVWVARSWSLLIISFTIIN